MRLLNIKWNIRCSLHTSSMCRAIHSSYIVHARIYHVWFHHLFVITRWNLSKLRSITIYNHERFRGVQQHQHLWFQLKCLIIFPCLALHLHHIFMYMRWLFVYAWRLNLGTGVFYCSNGHDVPKILNRKTKIKSFNIRINSTSPWTIRNINLSNSYGVFFSLNRLLPSNLFLFHFITLTINKMKFN